MDYSKNAHSKGILFNTAIKIAQGKDTERPLIAISDDRGDQKLLTLIPAPFKLVKFLL